VRPAPRENVQRRYTGGLSIKSLMNARVWRPCRGAQPGTGGLGGAERGFDLARPSQAARPYPRVNPIERPRYVTTPLGPDLAFDVEAADWAGLVTKVVLSISDALHPLGDFATWTARRVSAKGAGPDEILERIVATLLDDVATSGFLPALVEIEKADPSRFAGVNRGGCLEEDGAPTGRRFRGVVPGATRVTPGANGTPWRARVVLRPSPA